MSVLTKDFQAEIREVNKEIFSVIRMMGGDSLKYRKERRKGLIAVVSGIYSPPRVAAAVIAGVATRLRVVDYLLWVCRRVLNRKQSWCLSNYLNSF